MISNFLKNTLGLFSWSVFCVVVLAATYMVLMANYLGTSYSFYLQKMDSQPLFGDSFVGRFFEGQGVGNATLAQFYAAALTMGLAIGLFIAWNELFAIADSAAMCVRHRAAGNSDEALAFMTEAIHQTIVVFMLVCLLTPIIRWDLALFNFRGSAGQLANQEDAIDLDTWAKIQGVPSFATELTQLGAVGYACLTATTCLALELSARKARKYGMRLLTQVDDWATPIEIQDEQGAFGDYETAEHDVRTNDATTPIEPVESGGAQVFPADERTPLQEAAIGEETTSAAAEPLFVVPPVEGRSSGEVHQAKNETPSKPRATEQKQQSYASPAAPAESTVEVVGNAGERVSLRAALADKGRYMVDKATGRVWSRSYFDAIHGNAQQQLDNEDATDAS